MMPDQPSRVTALEIADLLSSMQQGGPSAPLAAQIAWHERKAHILMRIAADIDTPAAHMAAAEAWHFVSTLARHAAVEDAPEVGS
jgi:hypothetical protein